MKLLSNFRAFFILAIVSSGCTSVKPVSTIDMSGAPDYGESVFWSAFGDELGPAAAAPDGASIEGKDKMADVFYIHPTTFRSKTQWNQNLADTETNNWTDASAIARQASIFNDCCRIYAPRYRASSFLATTDPLLEGRAGEAYDFAYQDVLRAFDYYLKHENKGRPFVLAGHSQGGLMAARLLDDRVDSQPLQARMVAAYLIGYNASVGMFGKRFKTVKPCSKPNQVGCALSWNAVTAAADLDLFSKFGGMKFSKDYATTEGLELLCVNPLTFDRDRAKSNSEKSKGSVPGKQDGGPMQALLVGKVSAECQRGWLVVQVEPDLNVEQPPNGFLHYHDFSLFYEDVRQNIRMRIRAMQQN